MGSAISHYKIIVKLGEGGTGVVSNDAVSRMLQGESW